MCLQRYPAVVSLFPATGSYFHFLLYCVHYKQNHYGRMSVQAQIIKSAPGYIALIVPYRKTQSHSQNE